MRFCHVLTYIPTGAVEQLRTHVVRLANMYSEDQVQLYERGYGKDPAGKCNVIRHMT